MRNERDADETEALDEAIERICWLIWSYAKKRQWLANDIISLSEALSIRVK